MMTPDLLLPGVGAPRPLHRTTNKAVWQIGGEI